MPASQLNVTPSTSMGGNLVPGGATFRIWAPNALKVAIVVSAELKNIGSPGWQPADTSQLVRQADNTWTGFFPDFVEGSPYRFWVQGAGSEGAKRDPYARELQAGQPLSNCDCILRDPRTYPWHDAGYKPPPFHQIVHYQLHVGTFYAVDAAGQDKRRSVAKFLDVLDRIEYLRDLGINTVQLLPIQEYPSDTSMGYNGTDYFSPEMAYEVLDSTELLRYLAKANALLAKHGAAPLAVADLKPGPNQLKCLVDLFHLHGISVVFDIVYNHAGGDFGDQSLYFLDRQTTATNNNSLYFTDQGWAGGLVFAYRNPGVRQTLIDNAQFLYREYHIDGFRYDEVSVIDSHGGWFFCQDLTSTLRFLKPEAIQIAEYWNPDKWKAATPSPAGMGFDAALGDGLRDSVRAVIQQATYGQSVPLSWNDVAGALYPTYGFPDAWRVVQCIENQDIVYADRPASDWKPRVAALADPNDHRSWYARSRSRVATGIILTAPGIPMLFMGQEILEDKDWSDNPGPDGSKLIWWDGLAKDSNMSDFLQFCRGLIAVRKSQPAFSGPNLSVFHNYGNRVLGFHRWLDGSGNDAIVIASLNEFNLYNYEIGLPWPGAWKEIFNSDYFDQLPNPHVAGNGGGVNASGGPRDGFGYSASLVVPANGLLVLVPGS